MKNLNAKDENISIFNQVSTINIPDAFFLWNEEILLIFLYILSTKILSIDFSDFSRSPNICCAMIWKPDRNQRYQNSTAISGQLLYWRLIGFGLFPGRSHYTNISSEHLLKMLDIKCNNSNWSHRQSKLSNQGKNLNNFP